jgi:hypothetical protein
MLPEAVALGAETRNLGFGTLQAMSNVATASAASCTSTTEPQRE